MATNKVNAPKIDVLTSLRFFAAFLIVIYHAKGNFNCLYELPDLVFSQGVAFFFVLSGFILTYVYPKLNSVKEASSYFFKRLARIWPLHLAILFGSLLLLPKGIFSASTYQPEILVLLANMFMVQSWIPNPDFYFSYNSPAWSISNEMFFYLAFPLLLLMSRKSTWLPLVSGVVLTSLVIICTSQMLIPEISNYSQIVSIQGLIAINPLPRILEFIAGMTIAILFQRVVAQGQKLPNMFVGSIIEVTCIAMCISSILFTKPIVASLGQLPFVSKACSWWLSESGIVLVPFAILIYTFALRLGIVSRCLESRIFVYLGEISFAVYMCHFPLLKFFSFYIPQQRTVFSLVLFIAILLTLSHLLYKLVEMPSRTYLTGLYKSFENKNSNQSLISIILKNSKPNFKLQQIANSGLGILLLAILIVLVCPKLELVSSNHPVTLKENTYLKEKDIKVGNDIEIHSLTMRKGKHYLDVEFIVSSKVEQTINHFVSFQLLGPTGNQYTFFKSRLAPYNTSVGAGKRWKAKFDVPLHKKFKADRIGIAIAQNELLSFSGGRSDMGGKRLLVPLKTSISESNNRSNYH